MIVQMKRCRQAGNWQAYVQLVRALAEAGDRTALDDYARWVPNTNPTMVRNDHDVASLLQILWLYRDHPGMEAAAERLFDNPQSPWLPLLRLREGHFPVSGVFGLTGTSALRLAGFRKAVLKELDNKERAGTIHLSKEGGVTVKPPDYELGSLNYSDPELPAKDVESEFRGCDYFAWKISEDIEGAPRCELYWDKKRRDAAVENCKEFLQRYGDRLGPSLDLPRLDKPATPEQVKQGQAIFTLASEGKVRLVKLPEVPMNAKWVTLKDQPYKYIGYKRDPSVGSLVQGFRQSGRVWQAEEVLKDGKWQRYFGFVGSHRVARVPAAEIEFPDEGWQGDRQGWVALAGKIAGRLEVSAPSEDEEIDPRFAADAPLPVELKLRNRGGLDEKIPSLDGVRLRVWYSAEVVSPQGRLVPAASRNIDWTELPPKPGLVLKIVDERPLSPGEMRLGCKLDLRSAFEFARSGFYRVRLDSSAEKNDEDVDAEVRFSLSPPVQTPPRK